MAVKYVKGDALEYAKKEGYCMIHVCNAQGKMGSGIAKQVRSAFPEAYKDYMYDHKLGSCTFDYVNYSCCNLVAQEFYGYDGKRYLNYGALAQSLSTLMDASSPLQSLGVHTIVVPFKMGSDRAGGDWKIVIEMVEFIVGRVFDILVVEYSK